MTVVLSADGGAFKYSFDLIRGGECQREVYKRFMTIGNPEKSEFEDI